MIKAISFFLLMLFVQTTNGQLGILNRAKQNAKNKVNQKIDQKIDKGIDKAINKADTVITGQNVNTTDAKNESSQEKSAISGEISTSPTGTSIKANSKFDFVPGEKIIAFEDFSQDALGDFPDKWNTTSSGEVVTIDGQKNKWLALKKPGIFYPEFINSLPENFTLECDVAVNNNYNRNSASFEIDIVKAADEEAMKAIAKISATYFNYNNNSDGISLRVHPGGDKEGIYEYLTFTNGSRLAYYSDKQYTFTQTQNMVHVSIWKQKSRLRVYLNQEKIIDLPKALPDGYQRIIFAPYFNYNNKEDVLYLTNVRLAIGAADTRNKLITEGKFITHGILFDPGSDKINLQSYGALKEIALVLKENETVKVKIIGHTDCDGDDAANLVLSKKRADAVKNSLTKDFSIDAARMETSGLGETSPIESNISSAGKANNRRVEFIKL